MNILITNIDGNPQFIGGVKRVSSILGNEWKEEGHVVQFMTYLSGSDLRFDNIEGLDQSFLPNNKVIDCTESFDYFVQYVRANKIDIILHQFAELRFFSLKYLSFFWVGKAQFTPVCKAFG